MYNENMIVVNFKTYKEATGYKAINLARICKRVMEDTGIRIVAVPQIADLRACVETGAECWVQHVDPVEQGKNTGWITVEDVEEAGALGTLLNHSEHKLEWEVLSKTMSLIAGMAFQGCVCAADAEEAKKVAELRPNYIAYEPPELIASREKSVSSERPEVIEEVVKAVSFPVLVGAGVHSPDDVKTAVKLGAKGVLVATDIVLAEGQEKELRILAEGFKNSNSEQ
jgi:triosephosphate isomerase